MDSPLSLWALFAGAFISSTLLPGGSEIALGVLAREGAHSPWVLIAVATAGNALGGMTTWLLGYLIAARFAAEDLAKPGQRRALGWLRRWGSPALLFSWLPIVGDPLCFIAGWLRIRVWTAALFITAGKLVRYGLVLALVQG